MKKHTKRKGPFHLLSTREVYKNPWIRVREDHVIRPDGKRGIFGIVEAQPGSSIVPIDKVGYCYLTKEYHYGVDKITIEAISGGIDKGETPLEGARRELLEEAGLTSKQCVHLGVFYPFTTILNSEQHIFLALNVKKVREVSREERQLIKIIKIPFQKAVTAVLSGKINHAGSAIAILKADYYLRSKKFTFPTS